MNFNTDGFNDRTNFIHNSNDKNRLRKMGPSNIDSSFAQMKVSENRPDVTTVNTDKQILTEEARGQRENFILRNNNMMKANTRVNPNNPVNNAMNRNMFKNF